MVVAGESANDREVLRCFLEEFCPEMRGRIVFLNDKVPLRDAGEETLKKRVAHFAAKVRAKAARENASIAAVFVHEDLDEVDSKRYELIHGRVQRALAYELGDAHYVLAVWEIEAWLLLFPEEVTAFATKWQVPASRRGRAKRFVHLHHGGRSIKLNSCKLGVSGLHPLGYLPPRRVAQVHP